MDPSPVIYDSPTGDNRSEQTLIDHTCFKKYHRTYSGKIFFIFSPQQLLALSYFYLVFGAVLVFSHTTTGLPERTSKIVLKFGAFLVFCGWTTFVFVIQTVKIRMKYQYLQELIKRKTNFIGVSVPPPYQTEWLSDMLLPAIERGWKPTETFPTPRPYREDESVEHPEPSMDRDLPRPSASRRRRNRKKKNTQTLVQQVLESEEPTEDQVLVETEEHVLDSEEPTESDLLREGRQVGDENSHSEDGDLNLSTDQDEDENIRLDEPEDLINKSEASNVPSKNTEDLNPSSSQLDESNLLSDQPGMALEQSGDTNLPSEQPKDSSTCPDDSNLCQLQDTRMPSGQSQGIDQSSNLPTDSNISSIQTEDDQTSTTDNLNKIPHANVSVPSSKKRKRNRNKKRKKNQGGGMQPRTSQSTSSNLSPENTSLDNPEDLSCSEPEDSILEESHEESTIATGQLEDASLDLEVFIYSSGGVMIAIPTSDEHIPAASGEGPEGSMVADSDEPSESASSEPGIKDKTIEEPSEDEEGDWVPSRPKRKWNLVRKE